MSMFELYDLNVCIFEPRWSFIALFRTDFVKMRQMKWKERERERERVNRDFLLRKCIRIIHAQVRMLDKWVAYPIFRPFKIINLCDKLVKNPGKVVINLLWKGIYIIFFYNNERWYWNLTRLISLYPKIIELGSLIINIFLSWFSP